MACAGAHRRVAAERSARGAHAVGDAPRPVAEDVAQRGRERRRVGHREQRDLAGADDRAGHHEEGRRRRDAGPHEGVRVVAGVLSELGPVAVEHPQVEVAHLRHTHGGKPEALRVLDPQRRPVRPALPQEHHRSLLEGMRPALAKGLSHPRHAVGQLGHRRGRRRGRGGRSDAIGRRGRGRQRGARGDAARQEREREGDAAKGVTHQAR